jgi:GNAT superfamily N-acetyltransferase
MTYITRHLAPLWVVPDHQGRGIASALLRDGINIADQSDPKPPMYLEAMADARPIYERWGYVGVEGPGSKQVMMRNLPPHIKPLVKRDSQEKESEPGEG